MSLVWLGSIGLIPWTMAFSMEELDKTRGAEFAIDIVFAIDILLKFFTGIIVDVEVDRNLRHIAWNYIRGLFVFDSLSVIPTMVTMEQPALYPFKLLRVFRIK